MDVDIPDHHDGVPGCGAFDTDFIFPKTLLRGFQKPVPQSGILGFDDPEIGFPKTIQVQE
jgi:hypothetical protein